MTQPQMQAAQAFSGAAMVAFLAASLWGQRAYAVRMIVAGVYIAGILGFTIYVLIVPH